VVWFGYDSPRTIGTNATGGRFAAPAWAAFYRNGWKERPGTDWAPPPELRSRTIDAINGDLANRWCPVTQKEWFKPGTEPKHVCREHVAPPEDLLEALGRKLERAIKDLLGI
jgi:membrane carboxypeptidase/penicillin-binding protein